MTKGCLLRSSSVIVHIHTEIFKSSYPFPYYFITHNVFSIHFTYLTRISAAVTIRCLTLRKKHRVCVIHSWRESQSEGILANIHKHTEWLCKGTCGLATECVTKIGAGENLKLVLKIKKHLIFCSSFYLVSTLT